MKTTIFLASLVLMAFTPCDGRADLIITGTSITETFDGMPNTTTAGVFSATVGTPATVTNTGFVGTRLGGSGSVALPLTADNGTGSSGGLYSFGAASASDRALGAIASGTNIMGFGVKIVNGTGSNISDLTVSFTQENWRNSTSVVNTIAASFAPTSLSGVTDANFLTFAGFSNVSALDLVGPAPVTTNGALDGNLPANQVGRTFTFTGLNLANADAIYLRWQDVNDTGNDAGLAIDNFIVSSVAAVPEPTSMALVGLVGLSGLVSTYRRRKAK